MSRAAAAVRARVKRLGEQVVLRAGLDRLSRMRLAGRALVLAYHNILPDGAEPGRDRSLHLPQGVFEAQLARLTRSHDVVPLEDVLEQRGGGSRPRAVVTFDDAYRGAVTAGVASLARLGIPATIFVAPAFLGGRSFWWDAVAEPGRPALSEEFRRFALDELAGEDAAVRRWAARSGYPELEVGDHAKAAGVEELEAATGTGLITLGSHTWTHPNLTRLGEAELRAELERPLEWLRGRFARVVPVLSYPYGLATPGVEAAAERAGYRAAFRVSGGWMPRGSRNAFALPRLNVPAGLSPEGLALRGAGLFCR